MKLKIPAILIFLACTTLAVSQPAHDYPYQPVVFTQVKLTDGFWMPRIQTNKDVTIPFAFNKCEQTNRVKNFELAANVLSRQSKSEQFPTIFPFDDSDLFKIIEGASYSLHTHYDAKLDHYIDSLLVIIRSAQEPDGYLYTFRTMNPPKPHEWSGSQRWVNDRLLSSHELYNMGHFYEAAVAHFQATGKRTMLDMAIKNANLVYNTIGKARLRVVPGHQVIEMGLAKLYRVTGDDRYLKLASYFIEDRGKIKPEGSSYNQDHKPILEQDEAVGHAVRAGYCYAGVADVAALTGNKAYIEAIDKIWENVVNKKFYITGGIGARHEGEAFGDNYELPNLTAYNETCAAIANVFWNYRMFMLHGDAKYIDVMERSLYNNVVSGIGLDGKTFFYPNPLQCDMQFKFNSGGHIDRQPWFDCSCCPSNDVRIIASIPGYVYALKDQDIFLNLYISGTAEIQVQDKQIKLVQETNYPWDGQITVTIAPEKASEFALNMRIPGWATNQILPGTLYTYADTNNEKPVLKVNGKSVSCITQKGYVRISRIWQKGDKVELSLPMPVRRVLTNELVKDNIGRVSLSRGPVTYCAEAIDNKADVLQIAIPEDARFKLVKGTGLLQGIPLIKTGALSGNEKSKKTELTAIPYALWNNRGNGTMNVWFYDSK